jgi:hypothetical protein
MGSNSCNDVNDDDVYIKYFYHLPFLQFHPSLARPSSITNDGCNYPSLTTIMCYDGVGG